MVHDKCRSDKYTYKSPDGELCNVERTKVPEDKVDWTQSWPEYDPVEFTADFVTQAD